MDRINLFNPFRSRPSRHEDRLTWAFLLVLKYDPFIQNYFRQIVETRVEPNNRALRSFWKLASNVSTQTTWLESTTSRIVSVLLTDVAIPESIEVKWSRRDAKYDGVIHYVDDGLTFILENKLSHIDVWKEQLSPSCRSIADHEDIDLHTSAVCVEWSEILEVVLRYADSGTATYGSREILRDFLSCVAELHPTLTPYRTFELCGGRKEALDRRTAELVEQLGKLLSLESRDGRYMYRAGRIAERIAIWAESSEKEIKIGLWPADTVSQARRFFRTVDREAFLGLDEPWKVKPNLHFNYINKRVLNAQTKWERYRYFDYFRKDSQRYGQMDFNTLDCFAEQWEKDGLISGEFRAKIKDHFDSTKQATLNVIPGFEVYRSWKIDDIIEMEKDSLEEQLINALDAPLRSWGEQFEDRPG